MKRLTASEVRKNWFRVLDEVAAGQVVVVERKGRQVVIRREESQGTTDPDLPDYEELLQVPSLGNADRWGWDWMEGELVAVDRGEEGGG